MRSLKGCLWLRRERLGGMKNVRLVGSMLICKQCSFLNQLPLSGWKDRQVMVRSGAEA